MDPIGAVGGFIDSAVAWMNSIAPGGFGLLILPIGILAIITILVSRKR